VDGLVGTEILLKDSEFHPILTSTIIAFGFVFIHPLVDGNGRIHRYLIHDILAKLKFTPQGIIFPVSAAILERIEDYQKTLESYSYPVQEFIEWKTTQDNNVEVLNETIDYYRYFDATPQAEFLFECVDHTINNIIPEEVSYLQKYDKMKAWLDDTFEMPDNMIALLVRFLSQNDGKLLKRAQNKEFKELSVDEIFQIEEKYAQLFR
jgi:hypothetical protein